MNNSLQVIIVDDHDIVREGIKKVVEQVPGFEVLGSYSDSTIGLTQIKSLIPDICILDVSMPKKTGIDIVREISSLIKDGLKIIMMTRHESLQYLNSVLDLGVMGYILKDHAVEDLKSALVSVRQDKLYISPSMVTLKQQFDNSDNKRKYSPMEESNTLTTREKEVLKLVAEGYQSKDIAKMLSISYHTVKVHRKNILQKLGAKSAVDLVTLAEKAGLIEKKGGSNS